MGRKGRKTGRLDNGQEDAKDPMRERQGELSLKHACKAIYINLVGLKGLALHHVILLIWIDFPPERA